MKPLLGYVLIILGILGIIATALILLYLLFIIVIWCPLKACLPQFFVVLMLGGLSCGIFGFSVVKGTKLIGRRQAK